MPDAGWYPDPTNASQGRWWDGRAWTEHTYPPAAGPATGQLAAPDWPPRYLASPWRRLSAIVLDGLIALVMIGPLYAIVVGPKIHLTEQHGTISHVSGLSVPIWLLVVATVIGFAYEVDFIVAKGATPGKMIVGITDGHRQTLWDKFARTIVVQSR